MFILRDFAYEWLPPRSPTDSNVKTTFFVSRIHLACVADVQSNPDQ